MKKEIHPVYYPKAKVRCACGNTFTVGATRETMAVEICSHCHPFYTGTEKLIDIAGRVEKFRTRLRAAEARSGEAKARQEKAKSKSVVEKAVKKSLAKPGKKVVLKTRKGQK